MEQPKIIERMIREVSPLETINRTLEAMALNIQLIRDEQITNRAHMNNLIGPPSLEEKLKKYADSRDVHKHNNLAQIICDTKTILMQDAKIMKLELESKIQSSFNAANEALATAVKTEKYREENHHENNKRLSKLERTAAISLGALGALQLLMKYFHM